MQVSATLCLIRENNGSYKKGGIWVSFGVGLALGFYLVNLAISLNEESIGEQIDKISIDKFRFVVAEVGRITETEELILKSTKVKNTGVEPIGGGIGAPRIEVEFFDKDGGFIDECTSKSLPEVKPKQSENVLIECKRTYLLAKHKFENVTLKVNKVL